MRKIYFAFWMAMTLLWFTPSLAQSPSYELGKKAFAENNYATAMRQLTKAVTHEKYDMKGKDLPLAYSYLTIIRTAYLERSLGDMTLSEIQNAQGSIRLAIQELINAIQFQSTKSAELIKGPKAKLIQMTTQASTTVAYEILKAEKENRANDSQFWSNFILKELGDLQKLNLDNYELYNCYGLASFSLHQNEEAMTYYQKARELIIMLDEVPINRLQLQNYIQSSIYLYEQKQLNSAKNVTADGIDYIHQVLNQLGDDEMHELKKLSTIEHKLYTISSKITELEN